MSTTHNVTAPTIPHTTISPQQMVSIDPATPDLNPTDHSPLSITSCTHILNEVYEFHKVIK